MLSSRSRLGRREGFSNTLRLGSRAGSRALVVYLRYPTASGDLDDGFGEDTKVGIVVGKRQLPRAVDRNLVKRRLRHLLSERTETVLSGSRIVVRALGPSGDLSFSELGDALDSALNRAKKSQEKLLEASATRGHVNG